MSAAVDPWGLDPAVVDRLAPVAALRWAVEVDNAHRVPVTGPAVLLANRRLGWSEPFVVAAAIRSATGRAARVVGVPDLDPVGPLLRAVGGVLERPDEVAGLLRAGEVVVVWCGRTPRPGRHVGAAPVSLIAPAVEAKAPVLPVALLGRELGRRWRVRIGAPVPCPDTVGPLAVADVAVAARAGVRRLLLEAR